MRSSSVPVNGRDPSQQGPWMSCPVSDPAGMLAQHVVVKACRLNSNLLVELSKSCIRSAARSPMDRRASRHLQAEAACRKQLGRNTVVEQARD